MAKNNYPNNLQPENKEEISNYISVEAIRQLEEDKLSKQSIQKFYSNPPSHYDVNSFSTIQKCVLFQASN